MHCFVQCEMSVVRSLIAACWLGKLKSIMVQEFGEPLLSDLVYAFVEIYELNRYFDGGIGATILMTKQHETNWV